MELRFTRNTWLYWTAYFRNERRNRNIQGCSIPYQCLAQFGVCGELLERGFPRLTPAWSRIAVPRGCYAELPALFTYRCEELKDPSSGWWVVAYTEFAAEVAAFILYDVYDQLRLCALSSTMIAFIRALDLVTILGNRQNAFEMPALLRRIEKTRFDLLPEEWRSCGGRMGCIDASPGRTGPGADWAWYDPYEFRFLSLCEAKVRSNCARAAVPADHPRGWDFNEMTDGYVTPVGGHIVRIKLAVSAGWGSNQWMIGFAGGAEGAADEGQLLRGGPEVPGEGAVAVDSPPVPVVASEMLPRGGDLLELSDEGAIRAFIRSVGLPDEKIYRKPIAELRWWIRAKLAF